MQIEAKQSKTKELISSSFDCIYGKSEFLRIVTTA